MRDIKRRKGSIQSTQQITKAMKLVSTVKLQRAKANAERSKAYFDCMYATVKSMLAKAGELDHKFLRPGESDRKAVVVITSNRGLAGGYNSNVFKALIAETKDSSKVKLISIGKKAKEFANKGPFELIESVPSVEGASYEDIMRISNTIMSLYQNGDIDEVKLIYTEFISALSQEPRVTQLLPIIAENTQETEEKKGAAVQYLPSPAAVLGYIVPKYVSGVIYGGLAESYASEQAARRTAMESATDNANEMIATLELQYNRARQAAVTQEISEIVAGAAAQ
jgi:F-type H+-transporting ATPase subunit gamma